MHLNRAFGCFFVLSLLCAIGSADGRVPRRRLKILVSSPLQAWSHMQFLGKMADTLAEAGHEVHFLKLDYEPRLRARNETRLAQKVLRVVPQHTELAHYDLDNWGPIRDPFGGNGWPLFQAMDFNLAQILDIYAVICREFVLNTQLQRELAAEHYDVAISEGYAWCSFALFHRVGVKTSIATSALHALPLDVHRWGIPAFGSFYPNTYSAPLNAPHLNLWERFYNFANNVHDWLRVYDYTERQEPILWEHFGADFPRLRDIVRNISLFLVNTNPFFEFPRPISNKVINIGGLVDDPETAPLDERTLSILERSANGAILVSFGSIAETRKMGAHMRRALLSVFASRFRDFDFIWKLDRESRANDSQLFGNATNVHVFTWLQQSAILRHPKLRGFITHCGQNSLTEAARDGIPIVGIPLFADQLYNAVLARHKGIGVYVDVRTLHRQGAEEVLFGALDKILHDPSYRQNARMLANKLALTPFSPGERLTRWVEFAAEFPPLGELNLPDDEQLHWLVYFSVDVILLSAALLISAAFCAFKALSWLLILMRAQLIGGKSGSAKIKWQ